MATIRFSRLAEADLLSIADYTIQKWGTTKTRIPDDRPDEMIRFI